MSLPRGLSLRAPCAGLWTGRSRAAATADDELRQLLMTSISNTALEYSQSALPRPSSLTISSWAVTTRAAAQRFLAGVAQRVPTATVAQTASDEPTPSGCPRTICAVALSDVVWLDSVLTEVGAEPLADASLDVPVHSIERGLWRIDIVIDDTGTVQSWEDTLWRYSSRDGANKLALLLEIVSSAFPAVLAGQAWVTDDPAVGTSRLMSFMRYPDEVLVARPARAFVVMLFRALGVDPHTVEEVSLSSHQLAFPLLGGKLSTMHGPMQATERPVMPFKGVLVDTTGAAEYLDGAPVQPRVAMQWCPHFGQASVGAVISSPQGDSAVAYAMSAGYTCTRGMWSSTCEKSGCFDIRLHYVAHSDRTDFSVASSPSVASSELGKRVPAAVDVALFTFQRVNSVRQLTTTQPIMPFIEVTFPFAKCWSQLPLHGHARQIDTSRGDECDVQNSEYIANGWISAPTAQDPTVRHCLYLASQTKAMHCRGFVEGHSGTAVYAGLRAFPTLHSFVCQTVTLTCISSGRSYQFQGLTPAALALEQARRLLLAAGHTADSLSQLCYVAPALPRAVQATPTCVVS